MKYDELRKWLDDVKNNIKGTLYEDNSVQNRHINQIERVIQCLTSPKDFPDKKKLLSLIESIDPAVFPVGTKLKNQAEIISAIKTDVNKEFSSSFTSEEKKIWDLKDRLNTYKESLMKDLVNYAMRCEEAPDILKISNNPKAWDGIEPAIATTIRKRMMAEKYLEILDGGANIQVPSTKILKNFKEKFEQDKAQPGGHLFAKHRPSFISDILQSIADIVGKKIDFNSWKLLGKEVVKGKELVNEIEHDLQKPGTSL